MCEAFLQNYSHVISSEQSVTHDLVPTLLFFEGTNCSQNFKPRSASESFVGFEYKTGTTYKISSSNPSADDNRLGLGSRPKSFFAPFNYLEFTLTSKSGACSSTLLGPYLVKDVSLLNWQTCSNTSMKSDPIDTVTVKQIIPQQQWIKNACMGQIRKLGNSKLARFEPQSERCDHFMSKQFCIGERLESETECGCFKNFPDIISKSEKLKVNLPVICFGKECAQNKKPVYCTKKE